MGSHQASPQDAPRSSQGWMHRRVAPRARRVHRRAPRSARLPPPHRNQQENLSRRQRGRILPQSNHRTRRHREGHHTHGWFPPLRHRQERLPHDQGWHRRPA